MAETQTRGCHRAVRSDDPHAKTTIGQRITAAGYCSPAKYRMDAENTYTWGGGPTPRQAVTWWMTHLGDDGTLASNGHRKNILDPSKTELGVGVVLGSAHPARYAQSGTFVQDFGECIDF